jgi:hypothetical protein
VNRFGTTRRNYEIQNLTCDCIRELAANGLWPFGPAPDYGEYLYRWQQRANANACRFADSIESRLNKREQQLQEEQRAREVAEGERLLTRCNDLISKFLEIAERKVSVLDDYGDEQLHLLPREVDSCVLKIAEREGLNTYVTKRFKEGDEWVLPAPLRRVRSRLPELFAQYHKEQRNRVRLREELESLSGIEFETYVGCILQQHGWTVSGTAVTGDQGADLIVSKDGRKVIIQVKRYSGSVGNRAVQEVVGAVNFYHGTEGCVVTNSTFTPSARALAQKNNIRLIDGFDLRQLGTL